MRSVVLVLEENADRIDGFRGAVQELGAAYRAVFWRGRAPDDRRVP